MNEHDLFSGVFILELQHDLPSIDFFQLDPIEGGPIEKQ